MSREAAATGKNGDGVGYIGLVYRLRFAAFVIIMIDTGSAENL